MTKKELQIIEATELDTLRNGAVDLAIIDEASLKQASSMRTALKDLLKQVTDYKETKTRPLNEALKIIRAETKPLESAIDDALSSINRKMTVYQNEQVRIADEKASKIAQRVAPGKGNLSPETAVRRIDSLAVPKQVGSVKFNTVRKFEVMDVTLLPHEYILPNETAIRTAMRNNIQLPGVRYYEEKVPVSV